MLWLSQTANAFLWCVKSSEKCQTFKCLIGLWSWKIPVHLISWCISTNSDFVCYRSHIGNISRKKVRTSAWKSRIAGSIVLCVSGGNSKDNPWYEASYWLHKSTLSYLSKWHCGSCKLHWSFFPQKKAKLSILFPKMYENKHWEKFQRGDHRRLSQRESHCNIQLSINGKERTPSLFHLSQYITLSYRSIWKKKPFTSSDAWQYVQHWSNLA